MQGLDIYKKVYLFKEGFMMGPLQLEKIQKKLQHNVDIVYRTIQNKDTTLHIIFASNISDTHYISQSVIKPLIETEETQIDIFNLQTKILPVSNMGEFTTEEEAIAYILTGDAVIILPHESKGIFCEVKQYKKRTVETPPSEGVLKGPREGFTEHVGDNISMLTKRVKNPKLRIEDVDLKDTCHTKIFLVYLEDRVSKKALQYAYDQIEKAKSSYIITAREIENMLESKESTFDTIGHTEKPDIVAARLGEGRIAIFVDGTPVVITIPFFFFENFQAPDDYYLNKYTVSLLRILRWTAFFISIFVLPLYLALSTYHFSLVPTIFAFRLAVSRAGVPFPIVLEIILMMFFFQVLREAGVRLPQAIGQSISTVGALILGDTAVNSGLASNITVLVVALVTISSFLIPNLYGSIWIWSDILLIFAAFLGIPGLYVGIIIFWTHIASLESCGYPYLFPLGTRESYAYKDLILKKETREMYSPIFYRGGSDERD